MPVVNTSRRRVDMFRDIRPAHRQRHRLQPLRPGLIAALNLATAPRTLVPGTNEGKTVHEAQQKFRIGDLAVPAGNVVGPTYTVVDFDEIGNVTVAWREAGRIHERVIPSDTLEIA